MSTRVALLIAGLLVGAILGWMTAPKAVDVQLGGLSVQVDNGAGANGVTATGDNGQINIKVGNTSPLDDRNMRALIFAVVGGIIGFGVGFAMDRRKA